MALGEEAEGVLRYQDVHELPEGGGEGGGAVGAPRGVQHGHGARVLVLDPERRRPGHLGHGLGAQVAVRRRVAGQQEPVVDVLQVTIIREVIGILHYWQVGLAHHRAAHGRKEGRKEEKKKELELGNKVRDRERYC